MILYKLAVKRMRKALAAAWQSVPEHMDTLAKTAAPLADFVIKHSGKLAIGAALVALGADDLRLRRQRKEEREEMENYNAYVSEILQKHEEEIQALKAEAEGAQNLRVINDLLCKAVMELQESEKENEKAGNGTADQ